MTKSSSSDYQRAIQGPAFIARPDRTVISVTGSDRERFLQGMISNDIQALTKGKRMDASILTVKGKLIADLGVLNTGDAYWLEVEHSLGELVQATLDKYIIAEDVALRDLSDEMTVYSLLGSDVRKTAPNIPNVNDFGALKLGDVDCFAATADLPVHPTVQLFIPRPQSEKGEKALAQIASPISPETFEVLRIEAGIPRFDIDITEDNLLLEIPFLEKGVSYTKGCYIGQETIARLHARGGHVAKKLMGLAAIGSSAAIPVGAQVFLGEKEVGRVTSACYSPKLSSSLALSMIHREAFTPGTKVQIRGGENTLSASVVSLPL